MKVEQTVWNIDGWLKDRSPGKECKEAQLVIIFGNTDILEENEIPSAVNSAYPNAQIIGCASGYEISENAVTENMMVVTALSFDTAHIRIAKAFLSNEHSS